jgi:hypothetical protein
MINFIKRLLLMRKIFCRYTLWGLKEIDEMYPAQTFMRTDNNGDALTMTIWESGNDTEYINYVRSALCHATFDRPDGAIVANPIFNK